MLYNNVHVKQAVTTIYVSVCGTKRIPIIIRGGSRGTPFPNTKMIANTCFVFKQVLIVGSSFPKVRSTYVLVCVGKCPLLKVFDNARNMIKQ